MRRATDNRPTNACRAARSGRSSGSASRSGLTNTKPCQRPTLTSGNDRRSGWAEGLPVKQFSEEMEILYFPGCYLCYDPRLKKVATATAAILNKAGVNFGILGDKENCCGESIRKTGDEELFKRLARENIKTFVENGVHRILVSSPHCYHTFKNEYAEFRVNFEVVHITQFLFELIQEGKLDFTKDYGKKVTYHDPCYLGRQNDILSDPRQILGEIDDDLAEFPRHGKKSFYTGSGKRTHSGIGMH